jgi:antitoxin component of RelBE/YafQ-DinJ toxin-antitoxin module
MNPQSYLFLQTLNSLTKDLPVSERLSAEEASKVGEEMGLDSAHTLRLIEELKQEGLIDLHWPKLSITAKGRSSLVDPTQVAGTHINLATGAILVQNSTINESAVGQKAVRNVASDPATKLGLQRVTAELISARLQLIRAQNSLTDDEARRLVFSLLAETEGLPTELQHPTEEKHSKRSLEERLNKTESILMKLSKITAATASLQPVFQVFKRSLDWLSGQLGSGNWPSIIR